MIEGHEYKVEKFPLHPVVSEESPEVLATTATIATTATLVWFLSQAGFMPSTLHVLSQLIHIAILLGWNHYLHITNEETNFREMKQFV